MQNSKYKTVLCRYFSENKPCPLGKKCHFAHGKSQLRKVTDPLPKSGNPKEEQELAQQETFLNNYKTQLCKF